MLRVRREALLHLVERWRHLALTSSWHTNAPPKKHRTTVSELLLFVCARRICARRCLYSRLRHRSRRIHRVALCSSGHGLARHLLHLPCALGLGTRPLIRETRWRQVAENIRRLVLLPRARAISGSGTARAQIKKNERRHAWARAPCLVLQVAQLARSPAAAAPHREVRVQHVRHSQLGQRSGHLC